MAKRPVFRAADTAPYYTATAVEFTWTSGFSETNTRRNADAMQAAFLALFPDAKVLEIALSPAAADTLTLTNGAETLPVETAYAADPSREDPQGTYFDYLFLTALAASPGTADELAPYDAFTDVAFNPEKKSHTAARAAAIFTALTRLGVLAEAIKDYDAFLAALEGAPLKPKKKAKSAPKKKPKAEEKTEEKPAEPPEEKPEEVPAEAAAETGTESPAEPPAPKKTKKKSDGKKTDTDRQPQPEGSAGTPADSAPEAADAELETVPGAVVGAAVLHKKYGEGTIRDVTDGVMTVTFAEGDKRFPYPYAFARGFLSVKK